MPVNERGISGDREFSSTSWSLILRIQDPASPDYSRHMTRLVEAYWRPVYSVARHVWGKSHEDAKDLTQEFFATVVFDRDLIKKVGPEQRSFRAFLRTAIARFMVDAVRSASSQKRGGGLTISSLDALGEEGISPIADGESQTPEEIFDTAWKEAVLLQAVERLRIRFVSEGRLAAFDLFKQYDLDGDSAELSCADIGRRFSMTERQVRHALAQARDAFRKITMEIVSAYVDDPAQLKTELKTLFGH